MSLLLAVLTLAVPQLPAAAAPPPHDVVVTGRSLRETEQALKACIARQCPPDQDIAASLAHAENQFVAGDYHDARRTLSAATGRDRRFAGRYPVPVSDLMRASSRVAAHLGETREYRIDTIDALDALRAGLPANDPRVLAQRIEIADMFASTGRPDAADEIYGEVRRTAHTQGLGSIEAIATLRPLLMVLRTPGAAPDDRRVALHRLDRLAATTDPAMATYAMVARAARAQYQARQGDGAPLEALIAELRARGVGAAPVLVSAPPVDLPGTPEAITQDGGPAVRDSLTRLPVGSFEHQWIDVAYWVKPDGSVGDVDVVRQSAQNVGAWDRPVLKAIALRRYLPLPLPVGDPGALRVERYTYTSAYDDTATETRLRVRDGKPRLEVLDLTLDDAPKTAATNG